MQNITTALSHDEIDVLFEKNVLGTSSTQSLMNTVWLNNIIHLGLGGCREHRNLRWGDAILKTDSQGKEYLVQSFRETNQEQTGRQPMECQALETENV